MLILESGGSTAVTVLCVGTVETIFPTNLGAMRPRGGKGGGCFFEID